jgi:uncharacterized protein
MAIFLYRLNPPRATFPADMTPEEGAALESHFRYWRDELARGHALLFGPVADPHGAYGIAILNVSDEAAAGAICAGDPVLAAKLGFTFTLHEMPDAVAKGVVG